MPVELRAPSMELLPDYVAALKRGWSPDNLREKDAADELLERIAADPDEFLATCNIPEHGEPTIKWVDGTIRPRLPGYNRWIWDNGFCGQIGLRWSSEGDGVPDWFPYGNIGYGVPEWKRGRGYASAALALIIAEAKARGLTWVEITTDADNLPSQRVVEKNGGQVHSRENGGAPHKGSDIIRWRIAL